MKRFEKRSARVFHVKCTPILLLKCDDVCGLRTREIHYPLAWVAGQEHISCQKNVSLIIVWCVFATQTTVGVKWGARDIRREYKSTDVRL